MASVSKVNKRWRAQVKIAKLNYRKTKMFDDKLSAVRWGAEHEAEMLESGPLIRGRTFGELALKYADEVSEHKKGRIFENRRIRAWQSDALSSVACDDLDLHDIKDWIKRRELCGVSGSTINRELNLMGPILNYAVKIRWLSKNPMAGGVLKRPANGKPRFRPISDDEIALMCAGLFWRDDKGHAMCPRDETAIAFLLAIETGMRQGEIWALEMQHIHIDQRYVYVSDSKNSDTRDVPLSRRAIELLGYVMGRDEIKVFIYNQKNCATLFHKTVKMVGIDDLHFHDTRHEACTRLAQKLKILDLAKMIGHRDIKNLMIYYNPTATDIAHRLD